MQKSETHINLRYKSVCKETKDSTGFGILFNYDDIINKDEEYIYNCCKLSTIPKKEIGDYVTYLCGLSIEQIIRIDELPNYITCKTLKSYSDQQAEMLHNLLLNEDAKGFYNALLELIYEDLNWALNAKKIINQSEK